ncbi:immunoglobulin-like domain-containing protein, partial [Paenibacillus sp. TAF58]
MITGTVDTNKEGTYEVHYNVSDLAGNAANEVVRTIYVYSESSSPESPAPVKPDPVKTPEKEQHVQTVQVDVKAAQGSEGSIKDVVKFKVPAEAMSSDGKIHVSVISPDQTPSVENLQALSQVLEFTSTSGHTFN